MQLWFISNGTVSANEAVRDKKVLVRVSFGTIVVVPVSLLVKRFLLCGGVVHRGLTAHHVWQEIAYFTTVGVYHGL